MTPLVFSGNRGWLHSPAGNGPLREGIVFFSAYGVEDLATRHSLSRLAAQLSDTGHPVLRFDLPGTGDSLATGMMQLRYRHGLKPARKQWTFFFV